MNFSSDPKHLLKEKSVGRRNRSIARRMVFIGASWIAILLFGGGLALDRALTSLLSRNFDEQLEYILTAMIGSAEIEAGGEVYFNRVLGDQRFLEPNSGFYWQINGEGFDPYPSRSLWDRTLILEADHFDNDPHFYYSYQFVDEPLRLVERSILLPNSDTRWTFAVASATTQIDNQILEIRLILFWSFAALGFGLFLMALFQIRYGLSPLRRVSAAIQNLRDTGDNRIREPLPLEVQPLVKELNDLLSHSAKQAEEARTHAGNLAHALKTPLTVLTNAAKAQDPKLGHLVSRETKSMQRNVEHHLARARALGRRLDGHSRTLVWPSIESVFRVVTRLYRNIRFDLSGNKESEVALERQDLDEVLGNLVENAAKYGGGSVFITVDAEPDSSRCQIWIEDDGKGIPESERHRIFDRGARLDSAKPGTGLGLAISKDVVEIYGGEIQLDQSKDLGGLRVIILLPRIKFTPKK